MSEKSKNWNEENLKEVFAIIRFHRKDGGISMRYDWLSLKEHHVREGWMSERFDKEEEDINRMPTNLIKVREGGVR